MGCCSSSEARTVQLSNGWVVQNALVLINPEAGSTDKGMVGRVRRCLASGRVEVDIEGNKGVFPSDRVRVIVNPTKEKPTPELWKDGSPDRLPGGARQNALVRTSFDDKEEVGRVLQVFEAGIGAAGNRKGSVLVLFAPNDWKGRKGYERRITGQSGVWVVANPTDDNPRPILKKDGGIGKAPGPAECKRRWEEARRQKPQATSRANADSVLDGGFEYGGLYAGNYAVDFSGADFGGRRGGTLLSDVVVDKGAVGGDFAVGGGGFHDGHGVYGVDHYSSGGHGGGGGGHYGGDSGGYCGGGGGGHCGGGGGDYCGGGGGGGGGDCGGCD